jgi:kynurenine formamidase
MPVYGSHNERLEITGIKTIEKGDSCQVFKIVLQNHWGTHVDCPAHFFLDGKKIADYPPQFWHFKSPQLIKVQLEQEQILTNIDGIDESSDLLLIQTGWSKFRGSDIYSSKNPGLSPELGFYLRNNYPNIRAIGLDLISISSYTNPEIGRLAHKAFLDPQGIGHPILLIEDMFLPLEISGYKEIIALPLIVEEIDSSPCTIVSIF